MTLFRKCRLVRCDDRGVEHETLAPVPMWACKRGLDYFYGYWSWKVAEICEVSVFISQITALEEVRG